MKFSKKLESTLDVLIESREENIKLQVNKILFSIIFMDILS